MRRLLVALAGVTVGATVAWLAMLRVLAAVDIPRPQTTLDAVDTIRRQIDSQAKFARGDFNVVLLGDSLMMGLQPNGQTWVTGTTRDLLATKAAARRVTTSTKTLVYTGLSLYSYYFLLDEIVAMKPDLVVIELNLFSFSRFWQGRDRIHLAALMPLDRWPMLLELQPERIGLTVDELMLFRGTYAAGGFEHWRSLQATTARLARGYWLAAEALQQRVGDPAGLRFRDQHRLRYLGKRSLPYQQRATPYYARELLGPALDGHVEQHVVLDVLATLLSLLRREGIETLVYVPPYNVEHLKKIGVWNEQGIGATLATVRRTAETGGARFADCHGLLPDSAFRDAMDHLTDVGEHSGVRILADRLSQAIVDTIPADRSK